MDLTHGKIVVEVPKNKVVFGLTSIGYLIGVGHRDTDAGSNPRDFQGLSEVNKKVLVSMIENCDSYFWALHSLVSLTVSKGDISNEDNATVVTYDDACLTNGLQTVSLFRILLIIKILQIESGRKEIYTKLNKGMAKKVEEIMFDYLPGDLAERLVSLIGVEEVNKVLYYLNKKDSETIAKIKAKFEKISLEDFLNIKVSIKIVMLNEVITSIDDEEKKENMIRETGYKMATTQNDTQNVKEDDKFGTVYEEWMRKHLLDLALKKVEIQFRYKSASQNPDLERKHILDILRVLLPTTFFIFKRGEHDIPGYIASYANNRVPLYNWFEKVIKGHESGLPRYIRGVSILRNLLPDLIDVTFAVEKSLKQVRKNLTYDLVQDWVKLQNTSLAHKIYKNPTDNNPIPRDNVDEIIKKELSFSLTNILPIFIYSSRNTIKVTSSLDVKYRIPKEDVDTMVQYIYTHIAIAKLQTGSYSSTSDLFRNGQLYREAERAFHLTTKNSFKNNHDIDANRVILD